MSTGRQRVTPTKRTIRSSAPTTVAAAAGGDSASRLISSEAVATAPQKAFVTCGPAIVPPGRRGLVVRCFSIQANGSRQTVFVCGPVGPLLKPFSFSPQRP